MRDLLVLTPDFPPATGGIQTLMHRITASLERYRPQVVTLGSDGDEAFDRAQPFPITRIRMPGSVRRVALVALNARGLAQAVSRRPAAILSGHIVTGPAAIAARRWLGVPVVQYAHAQELSRRPDLARRVLGRADATIVVSRHTRSLVLGLGVPRDRIHVVHPGVDTPTRNGASGHQGTSIVVVARLKEPYKGHDVLLRALPLVRHRVPTARLDVIGDGPLRGHLETLARGNGVAGAVTFHGRVSDGERNGIMRRASVFAMPSRVDALGAGEGFGIVYVEAGSMGLPVVAGRVAGALDAVVDGETGLLVDPESPDAVAEAIISILTDRQLAERLGAAGREHARTLSWERAAGAVEDVLDTVVAR